MSSEAAVLIAAAYTVLAHTRSGRDPHCNEELEVAEVRYKHALRRLKQTFPGEFCGWSERSSTEVIHWTLRFACIGHPIPAAEVAARRIGLDMEWALADMKARMAAGGLRVS